MARDRNRLEEAAQEPVADVNALESLFAQAKVANPIADREYENLPDGDYEASIERVEYKNNKKGNPMITYTLKVLDDNQYNGRLHWKNVNLVHSQSGEFMPGQFRTEMDFIYGLLDEEVTEKSDINEFMDILDEINEIAKTNEPIIVDMKLSSREMRNGGIWVNCTLK